MIRDLVKLRELITDTTLLVLQYDLHFDGNEILFKYWIYRGFGDTKIEEIRNLNACSYKTNRAYFYKELLSIRRYIKINQSPIDLKGISSKDLNPEYAKLVNENWEDLI